MLSPNNQPQSRKSSPLQAVTGILSGELPFRDQPVMDII